MGEFLPIHQIGHAIDDDGLRGEHSELVVAHDHLLLSTLPIFHHQIDIIF